MTRTRTCLGSTRLQGIGINRGVGKYRAFAIYLGFAAAATLVALASPPPAAGAPLRTFHVDVSGNDAADGSALSPWRTLQRAATAVRAGDLVRARAGRYAGFDLRTSGTAPDPIVFSADPGVVIDTPNPVTPNHGINIEGASYIVIEGFTVSGMPRAGIRSVLNHHVTIRHNTADANGRWGIFSGFSDDLWIESNIASRSQIEHGIYVSNSGDRPIIRGNLVWGNYANGIHMNGDLSQGGDGIISGALVEENVIHDNGLGGGSGINADGVQASRFQNNLLYGNHAGGISLYRIDGAQGSKNNVVAHNTIVQAADGRWAVNITGGSTSNTVLDNILFNTHPWRGSITVSPDSLAGLASDFNVVMDRFSVDDGNSRVTLAQWRAATGGDQHSIIAPPAMLFRDPAQNDYHLRDDSPARDAGLTLLEVDADLEGTPRPLGPASDVGAFELAGEPVVAFKLSVIKVGSGSVTSTPAGIACGVDCETFYPDGTTVTLTPTPAAGFAFSAWTGGGCGNTTSCAFALTADTAVTATFVPAPPPAPDLIVSALSDPPAKARRGTTFTVSDTVGNQGTGSAAQSTTRYYLSTDRARNSGDILLTGARGVPALGPAQQSTGSTAVKIPASTAARVYVVLACADDTKVLGESNEQNNCRASAAGITVSR